LKEFPPLADCVETGRTFLENARQKADYYFRSLRHPVLAEDSGLVIPALDGFPGILSARVAADDASRIRLVLQRLEGNPHRAAKYVCSMVFRTAERIYEVEAECHGTISETPAGQEGFGYDPIFCPQDSFQTFGQMPLHAKSTFSHRAKSLRKMLPYLLRELAPGNRQ
jgi:XTP/dITP diphosphohydrolase